MENNTDNKAWHDWFDAFSEHGKGEDCERLANECEHWTYMNPGMTWQDAFDAVLLTDETT